MTTYLGVKVLGSGHGPNPETVEKCLGLRAPKSRTELQSFLGLVNFFREYVPNLAKFEAPFGSLLTKKGDFTWNDSFQTAFEKLKNAVQNGEWLMYADENKDFFLLTDASGDGMGAVLLQIDDNTEALRPVYYWSRKWKAAERNYTTPEQEMLALVEGIEHFDEFLRPNPFFALTDHANVVKFFEGPAPRHSKRKSIRYDTFRLRVSGYQFIVIDRPRQNVFLEDYLSRIRPKSSEI